MTEMSTNVSQDSKSPLDEHYVYLISCHSDNSLYIKIGLTSSIQRRLVNIQTGCPFPIAHVFVVLSKYREEVEGLEKLLHMLLEPERLRGEWYEGTPGFFEALDAVFSRINSDGFSYDELLDMPDFVGPEFEIMMHRHEFCFLRLTNMVRKGANPIENAERVSPGQIANLLLQWRTAGEARCT